MAGAEIPDVEQETEGRNVDNENEDAEKQILQEDEITGTDDKIPEDNIDEKNLVESTSINPPKEDAEVVKSVKTTAGKNEDKDNNNIVTVELSTKEPDRNSPEIVVEPKFAERLSSDKLTPQTLKLLAPQYYPIPPERKPTPPSLQSPNKSSFIKKFKHCLLLTIFTIIVVGYAIGGAYLFSHLERKREIEYNAKIDKWKNDTAILLATELRQVTPYEEVWARKVFHYLEAYEKDLLKASAVGYRRFDHKDREQRWTWTSSLFFSVALMTTTGYGPMTPRSKLGRIAAVFYSIFGIPLALSWFMIVGYTLATFWASLFQNICCSLCHERPPENLENSFPAAKPKESLKILPKLRTNSIVPIEEQRLITRADSKLSHSAKVRRSMFPPECNTEYVSRNNQAKDLTENFQSSACSLRKIETEIAQIKEVYHTMDYATAIVYASLLFVVYFMFFSILFAVYEGWILTDILYFSYLMFVTLGPGCHEMEDDGFEIKIKNNPLYTVHLCIGYCILAMILNLIYLLSRGRCECDKERSFEDLDSFPCEKF